MVTERMRVLIEVHIAKEEAKSGAEVEELPALAEKIVGVAQAGAGGTDVHSAVRGECGGGAAALSAIARIARRIGEAAGARAAGAVDGNVARF